MTRWICLLIVLAATPATAAEPKPFELLDGDRVVFLGNTLIEREQKYGYWELMLTMAWPERNVTFRNLGWSGDTVWGESRAGFGTQADGFKKLLDDVNAAQPTVIFVGYGNVEAFDGEAGLPKFIEGYNKLLDELEKTKARIVVLGPILQNKFVSPNPKVTQYNDSIRLFSNAINAVRKNRDHHFVELVVEATNDPPIVFDFKLMGTTSGSDVDDFGYLGLSGAVANQLSLPFVNPLNPDDGPLAKDSTLRSFFELLTAIRKKNELFFHRWRPQNETYLFGFRKHEQGINAKEVFAFDPLIAAEEKKIAELRTKLAAEMKKASDSK